MDRQSLSLSQDLPRHALDLNISPTGILAHAGLFMHCGSVDGARLRAVVGSQGTWRTQFGSFCADIISRGFANVIPMGVFMLQSFAKSFHLFAKFPEASEWRLRLGILFTLHWGYAPWPAKSTKTLAAIRVSFLLKLSSVPELLETTKLTVYPAVQVK